MRGITIDELKDKLLHGHEVEFTYLDCEYSIESELIDGNNKVQIWKCAENDADCIASMTISKDEEIEETKSKKNSLNQNEQREVSELLQKIKQKDKEIAKLKEEILSQNKKNEEANKKINQLTEELKLVQAKLQNYNKKLVKSKSKEKYSINVENKNNIKFNKLFSEDEKKALSTLFKSEEELYNFNNKISILEDRNTKIENELKEQNKQLIKQLNEKDEKIKVLEKGNNTQININENSNNIEFLKKEIDMLKSHKFFVLKIQKQLQMNYMEIIVQ